MSVLILAAQCRPRWTCLPQPTFVAMYAELCRRLGTELPELSPPDGETQPMSFQKLLLNTCQDEFEGTADARAVRISAIPPQTCGSGPSDTDLWVYAAQVRAMWVSACPYAVVLP